MSIESWDGDIAFEVQYVCQMPDDVPVWVEKALIVGSWWLRRFARDLAGAVIFTALCWALGSLQQLSYGEPTISLFHPAILHLAFIQALCVHAFTCGFGKSALQHRVVLLPPGTCSPPPRYYRLLDITTVIVVIAMLATTAWVTRPEAMAAHRALMERCEAAADFLLETPPECSAVPAALAPRTPS